MTLTHVHSPGGPSSPFPDAVRIDDTAGGVAWIPAATPLTRLNYYDGRFLRADDLNVEQRAQRAYVALSNQAGGPGVTHGFDLRVRDGSLVLSPGLAIDPPGRVLFLPCEVRVTVATLVEAAAATGGSADPQPAGKGGFAPCEVATATPSVPTVAGMQLYLVALAHAEGLCGTAEVFGRLCDDACITATDRPYRLDGVVLLLRPLTLTTPLPTSAVVNMEPRHLRSRVASAAFADERAAAGSRLSAAALTSNVWCLGAPALPRDAVPLGVLAWDGTSVGFLDMWTARRELMETPPRSYWAGRLELRPWPVFLAQVLQFQCQLADILTRPPDGWATDACGDAAKLLGESTKLLEGLAKGVTALGWKPAQPAEADDTLAASMAHLHTFRAKVTQLLSDRDWAQTPPEPPAGVPAHLLIDGGIVETPAAGYLPVDPGSTRSLRAQVQDLLGAGVDLRVCAVRRDQIPHELERAQHMDRISLLRGLDDPAAKENVDVLVPDGFTVVVPAADRTQRSLEVRPSTDWVLFRRRRREDCDGGVAPAPPALVGAFVTRAEDPQAAADISRRLRNPEAPLDDTSWNLFATPEFEIRTAALRTSAGVLRQGYHNAGGGALIAFAGYAAPADAPIGRPRALAVATSLTPEATLAFPIDVDLVTNPPPVPPAPGTEASVFLVSYDKPPPEDCVDVALLDFSTEQGDQLRAALAQGNLKVFGELRELLTELADVSWTDGSVDDEQLTAILSAYQDYLKQQEDDGHPVHAFDMYAWIAADWAPEHEAQAEEHLKLLAQRLDIQLAGIQTVDFRHEGGCPVLLVIMLQPVAPPPPPIEVAAFVARVDGPEPARDLAHRLRSPGTPVDDVSWRQFGIAEFDHDAAELRTPGEVLRPAYHGADGGALIAFAGYIGVDDPVGPPRAEAVAKALEPDATLVAPADIGLVTNAPPVQMPPGAEGSVILVSYDPPKLRDCVNVRALPDYRSKEGIRLATALSKSDEKKFRALENILILLGDVSWTGDTVDQDQLEAMVGEYKQYVELPAAPRQALDWFAWIAKDWAEHHEEQATKHLELLTQRLNISPDQNPAFQAHQRVWTVDFEHEDSCPVLLIIALVHKEG